MKRKTIDWGISLFLVGYHVALAILMPLYLWHHTPHWGLLVTTFVLLYASGLAITGGYHRYFSHRSYQAKPFLESFWLTIGALALQGSALKWSFDHRNHHAYVDTDRDPYSIKKGFLFAHCLWLFRSTGPIDEKVVSDLVRNPRVMMQHRHIYLWMTIANTAVTLFMGWLCSDLFGAVVFVFLLRIFLLHHFTWFINSLAHTWGDRPFSEEQSAVDNYLISLLTFGEGYHNYHHTYANDYRNGIRWYHFDPTKWLIWTFAKLGWATGLKRVNTVTVQKRMISERAALMRQQLTSLYYVNKEVLETKIQELADRLTQQTQTLNQLSQRYAESRQTAAREKVEEIRKEMTQIRLNLKADWKRFTRLSKGIMRLRPLEEAS